MNNKYYQQKIKQLAGITLIEMIISMVIISISLTGVFTVMNLTVGHSADPIINHQALAIAEACMEEILLEPYASLSGCNLSLSGFPTGYSVSSNIISHSDTLTLSGVKAKKVLVTVTYANTNIKLAAYRTNY